MILIFLNTEEKNEVCVVFISAKTTQKSVFPATSFLVYLCFKLPFCISLDNEQHRIILARRQLVLNQSEVRISILAFLITKADQ